METAPYELVQDVGCRRYGSARATVWIVLAGIFGLCLSCGRRDTARELAAERTDEPGQVLPAPLPLAAVARPHPTPEPEFLGRLRLRKSQYPIVVQGRVARISIRERTVPPEVWPE